MKKNLRFDAVNLLLVSLLLISSLALLPLSAWAEPSQPPQQPPSWYVKPPYPDYAPSGMPDFDQRQDRWWRNPDAVAVWQHYNESLHDWDIYYSIYTDPNMWWTLGCQNARSIVRDSLAPGPVNFLPGNDMQPAISWYSNNYAIAVWQHWNVYYADWDIWYSRFVPGVGWTWPAVISSQMGEDFDPAIAFDTNGYAVCVWRHRVDPTPPPIAIGWKIAYSVWSPVTLTWTNINFVPPPLAPPTNAMMPEVCVDSQHNVVVIWTDNPAFPPPPGKEQVWFSWALLPAVTPPPALAWSLPAIVPGCPLGINWQKGISPDNLGNNLIDFGYPAPGINGPGEPLTYAQFTSPGKTWTTQASNLTNPATHGEHPDVAFDLNNKAIAVYTNWPGLPWPQPGPIYYSFWNGSNWQPIGGAFAASAATGTHDQWPALAFMENNRALMVWQSALNTTQPESPPGQQTYDTDIFFSVYSPPYPPGAWTPAAFVVLGGVNNPNGGSIPSIPGEDLYVDIASPTGSPTTPPSVPPQPQNPDWSFCGPTAVANSLWWFDSKFEPKSISPPAISDGFPLVKSYNPGVWDDHDPQNVQPFIQHLAWLMDTDGQRTRLCHSGTTVWDMQAGITQYLSWSGVNPLGDVNGDGIVDVNDLNIINAAMNSQPGMPNWNLAADIWPETELGPKTADNKVDINDWKLVNQNLGNKGMFYEHTIPTPPEAYPDFFYIEEEVEKCQDVILLLGFYQQEDRDGGHFVTVAGVNSSTQQLLISNPIRDDFEAGTPGRSPVPHGHPIEPPYTTHNNASLVSQDAYTVQFNQAGGYWYLVGYDPAWETRIEYAVITSPYEGIVGDFDGDFDVDYDDILYFVSGYITYWSGGGNDPKCDFDSDGDIDYNDILTFVSAYIDYWTP